jgi:hypothetical protein
MIGLADIKGHCTVQTYHSTTTNPNCLGPATSGVMDPDAPRGRLFLRCEEHRGQLPDGSQGEVVEEIDEALVHMITSDEVLRCHS